MPNRYKYTKIKKSINGNRVYQSTIYPEIEIDDDDIFIVSIKGERLDNLAYEHYKDPTLWWVIAKANEIRNGKFTLEGGLQIRIPINIQKILLDLETINK